MDREEDALLEWAKLWHEGLRDRFPEDVVALAKQVGNGLRALLDSEPDLDEALHTCVYGLLAARRLTIDTMRIVGQRLMQDAIEPLEEKSWIDMP